MSKEPEKKFHVVHGGFSTGFYEWERTEAENKYEFWKKYYDCEDKRVLFFEDGKLKKRVTYRIEVVEEIID